MQLWFPNLPDLNPVDNRMYEILQEKVYKTLITDPELSTTPLTNGCHNDDMISSLAHSVLSRCFNSSRLRMRIFTPSLAIVLTCCNKSDSNLANLEATVELG